MEKLRKLKVGGIDYDVSIKDLSQFDAQNSFRMGQHHEMNATIEISDKLSKQKRDQTFVHELLHAIVCESGLELDDEETVVNQMGLMLYQVLKDNDLSLIRESKEEINISQLCVK